MSFREIRFNECMRLGLMNATRVLGVSVGVLLLCTSIYSQGNAGRILGTVTDASGGAVAGAAVRITDVQRGISRNLTSDEAGEYAAPNLLPGAYTVRAEAKGFKTVEHSGVSLEVGQDLRIDLTLQPGDQSQTVVVSGGIPLVDTTSAVLGGSFSNQAINDLPLNGRNYQNLLTLRPGVMIYPGGGGWSQSANDIRPEANNYIVDGLTNDEPFSALSVINAPGLVGDAVTVIPIDAIQEFTSIESPKAEYGWKPGATVSVGLKSGTNSVHGTAYAFGRTDAFDALNYFVPTTQPLAFEQFGATGGGPIIKDKVFFFLGYEGQRYTITTVLPSFVPTTSPVPGPTSNCTNVATGNCGISIPDATADLAAVGVPLSPLSVKLLSLFPANTSTSSSSVILPFPNTNSSDSSLVKIDYHVNEHHTLSGTFFYGRDNEIAEDQAYLSAQWLSTQTQKPITGGGSWTWTPKSTLVNEARIGYLYDNKLNNAIDHGVPATTYGINTGVTDPQRGGMPQINISGFTPLGGGVNWPKFQGPDSVYQAIDSVSFLRGKHAFKFGGEVRYGSVNEGSFRGDKGQVIFNSGSGGNAFPGSTPLEDYLAGAPQFGRISFGPPLRHETQWSYAGFFQDDWRLTSRLTLNLGVRYEYVTPMREDHNLLGNFVPALGGLVQVGQQISSPYRGDHNNFAPRLGLAWDISGKSKTIVRAGFGVVYDNVAMEALLVQENTQNATAIGLATIPTGATIVVNGVSTPGTGTINVTSVTFPGGPIASNFNSQITAGWQNNSPTVPLFPVTGPTCGDGVGADPPPCNILGIDRNFRTPYVTTWNIGVQHAFTNNLSLDVAYVGNHGSKLLGIRDLNQPALGTSVLPFGAQFPYLGAINFMSNLYRANYNGLQVTMTQRLSHGLSFTAGYTYSHGLDDSSTNQNQFLPQDSTHPEREYASSDYDMRHRFTLAMTYTLPGREFPGQLLKGWEINGIVTLQSPQPWTVNDTGNNISGTNENTDRWDFFGRPSDFQSSNHSIPFCTSGGDGGCTETLPNGGTFSFSQAQSSAFYGACTAAAVNVDGGAAGATTASLLNFGCYAQGRSVMIPPAAGTFGTMGRNLFRDAGFRNLDLSVTKYWKFGERLTAQFRAEFFNALNHPNFANPYGGTSGYGPGNFDDPSQTANLGCGCATPDVAGGNPVVGSGSNRAIQLGLKLIF
jgi:Carboxypeptidase regulatory-like domain/TonB dependent receptor